MQQRIPQPPPSAFSSSSSSSLSSHSPLLAVLLQEHSRYTRLFRTVHAQIADLLAAQEGRSAMTQELESVAHALRTNRTPRAWRAPGTHASLRAWIAGTVARAAYIDAWKANASCELPGSTLWMGALFHPQAYLAATAQVYARKHKVAVDNVFMHGQVLQVITMF